MMQQSSVWCMYVIIADFTNPRCTYWCSGIFKNQMGRHFCLLERSITVHLQLQTWRIQQNFEEYREKDLSKKKKEEYLEKRDKLMKVRALYVCKLHFYFCCFFSWL